MDADFRGLLGSQDDSKTGRKKPPASADLRLWAEHREKAGLLKSDYGGVVWRTMHGQKLEILSTKSETNSKCEWSNDQNRDRGGRGFRIAYLAEKRVLEKKGRVVDQRNHNELRFFSTATKKKCTGHL